MNNQPGGGKKTAGKKAAGEFHDPALPSANPASPAIDDLGELPRSYGTDTIFLVAQEPHWLFTYWDIDISLHPGGKTFLRVTDGGDHLEQEIEVPFETRNWYIPVQNAGGSYAVEIGYYRGTLWNCLAKSVTIQTPPDKMSDSGEFDYATLPLHISFQRLMENIQSAIQDGEMLLQALARLQKDGRLLPITTGLDLPAGSDEYILLEALLGKEVLSELTRSSLSSEELTSRIHKLLEERLSSAGSSELLAGGRWSSAESSLFSAITALTGGSSWNAAALSSWAAAALTSWAAAAQTSWSAAAQSSWTTAETSSWSAGAMSSWTAETLASWIQAVTSSWSTGALASWSQAAASSWSHAETSSWGGSENVGSFGFAQRDFFMHVNAEVIFYGGTHPDATVTIDGKPVRLNPDGTFRHHFIFPDGEYDIPITATSPDGVETRSATLNFRRSSARTGAVGSTAQPPLPAPMGAKL